MAPNQAQTPQSNNDSQSSVGPVSGSPQVLKHEIVLTPLDSSHRSEGFSTPSQPAGSSDSSAQAASTPPRASSKSNPAAVAGGAIPDERVQQIIHHRKNSALGVVMIVIIIILAPTIITNRINTATLIAGAIFIPFLLVLYAVNAVNYPKPSPSYRKWNKVVYIFLAKFGVVLSIFQTASDVKEAINPLHGFGNHSVPSRPELLVDAAMSAGVGYTLYKGLKPAAYIEEYYKKQDFSATHTMPPQ